MKLAQRVAVITGAGSGIGQAMALLFAREGAHLLVADVNEGAAQETAGRVTANGGTCTAIHVDVSQPEHVRSMIEQTRQTYGRLDILCNNAGIGSTTDVIACEPDEWDHVMNVNVKSVYLGCKYALPIMIAQGSGVIINTASIAGMVGLVKRAAYSASKGAVIALTRQVAIEYVEHGIRVNCLCPGTVDSPWVGRLLNQADDPTAERASLVARQPMGRLGKPEVGAAGALFFGSVVGGFITCTGLIIDGGLTAR